MRVIALILAGAVIVIVTAICISRARRRDRQAFARLQAAAEDSSSAADGGSSSAPADESATAAASRIYEKLYTLAFGFTLKPPSALEPHLSVAKAIAAMAASVSVDPRYVPRRPMLLPQLMKAINDKETARDELATLIQKDPGLAGNLLKLANSPLYRATAQPVDSIDRAVAMLGTDGIRSLVTAALLQPVFRIPVGVFARFPEVAWEHSFLSSGAAEAHASVVENTDAFAAQLSGMLLGLGTIMVFRAALDQYEAKGSAPNAFAVAAMIDEHAATVGHRIADGWELSDDVKQALKEQYSEATPQALSPIGRALKFGRLAGALALLRSKGLVDDAESKTAMLLFGASAPHFEKVWSRLTSAST